MPTHILDSAVSGGADGGIAMWDLEAAEGHNPDEQPSVPGEHKPIEHRALAYVSKSEAVHTHGITGLSFYPFDSLAFLSSSYDHRLKIFDSTTLVASAAFDLGSVVYAHAMSPIAQHLLVACALQHPAVRLVDLRSSAATHTLAGHGGGAVLGVAWSPKDEHLLASGATDGTVRFWDIRRSAGTLGVLDMDDSIGVVGYDGRGLGARSRHRGKAHAGPVNGLVWTEDARYMVTVGHDERIRVWDMHSGANTLAAFGPTVRNRKLASLMPLLAPRGYTRRGQDMLFYPNQKEIIQFDLLEGRMIKKLRPIGAVPNQRDERSRVTTLAWRAHDCEMLSAHSDGYLRSWRPRTALDALIDEQERLEDAGDDENAERKRKRDRLEEIERELTTRRITWT